LNDTRSIAVSYAAFAAEVGLALRAVQDARRGLMFTKAAPYDEWRIGRRWCRMWNHETYVLSKLGADGTVNSTLRTGLTLGEAQDVAAWFATYLARARR
jgi:hypothetical protein